MNVLFLCFAGMSTSLLVSKMQKYADDKGLKIHFDAVGAAEFDEYIEENEIKKVLMGPQLRHMLDEIRGKVEGTDITVDVIDPADYGRLNVENIMKMIV